MKLASLRLGLQEVVKWRFFHLGVEKEAVVREGGGKLCVEMTESRQPWCCCSRLVKGDVEVGN